MSDKIIKFYTKYAPPPAVNSPCGQKSLTDVSQMADCDINTIVRRYNAGDRSMVRTTGLFADVSQFGDYQSCLEKVRKADADFSSLPAAVRDRVGNNPLGLIKFLADSANDEEAIKLGLKVRPVAPAVADVKEYKLEVGGVTSPEAVSATSGTGAPDNT